MAITIDWGTRVIYVPKADTVLVQASPSEIRELDVDVLRLRLKDLEDDDAGIPFPTTHVHNPPVSIGGVTLARVIELINGYTITFEDGIYIVNIAGGNSNIADVTNLNSVSIRTANSAGLVHARELEAGVEQVRWGVETLRHTHQGVGAAFYVDPVYGSDLNSGDTVPQAFATLTHALDVVVSGRGDVIYLVSQDSGTTTITERVVINKEDVHLRGPGRGFQFQPTTPDQGAVLTVNGNNCSMSGFIVRAPVGSTSDDCIVTNGKFFEATRLYLVGTQAGTGNGFLFRGGDYHELHGCESEKMGGSALKTEDAGLPTGSPREITVVGGNYYLNNRDGIELTGDPGNPTNSTRIIRLVDVNIHDNLRYGVSVDANTTQVVVLAGTAIHSNPTDIFTLNAAEPRSASEWDQQNSLESGMSLREAMRIVTAALAGKLSGAPAGPVVIRNVGDTKDRIIATVDEDGNRTGVTTDVS
jgi:FlaG/FlaF family flagellin (archaellin)